MLAIEMLAGDINFVQVLHLSFSSPAAPGEPHELLTPQTPFLIHMREKDNESLLDEAISL